jgi:hypothetical protein
MKAFRVGFITTLSFLLVTAVVAGTLGFYLPPQGEKAPEYPLNNYPSYNNSDTVEYQQQRALYQQQQQAYQDQLKSYQESQKTFVQDKIIPYTRNVFILWILAIVIFEITGLLLIGMSSSLVGSGFVFTGFWAVVYWPIGGIIWYVNSIVSGFAGRANQEFSSDPLLQAVSLVSIGAVVLLSIVGLILERRNKSLFI